VRERLERGAKGKKRQSESKNSTKKISHNNNNNNNNNNKTTTTQCCAVTALKTRGDGTGFHAWKRTTILTAVPSGVRGA
jgi:hypothetical protein